MAVTHGCVWDERGADSSTSHWPHALHGARLDVFNCIMKDRPYSVGVCTMWRWEPAVGESRGESNEFLGGCSCNLPEDFPDEVAVNTVKAREVFPSLIIQRVRSCEGVSDPRCIRRGRTVG